MKVMVTGSRSWTDEDKIFAVLDRLLARAEERGERFDLLHGGAEGADTIASEWAASELDSISEFVFPPDYAAYGKAAPHVRNDAMLAALTDEDLVVAFWDGKSRGTKSVIDKTVKRGLGFEVYAPEGVEIA